MAGWSPAYVFHHLEITLISAQDLKPPSAASGFRRMRTHAIAWVDPSAKLRTVVDRVGGENPTWNEKFLFRVPAGFLASDSSSTVHVEIYAVGLLVDSLVGTVDFLIGNQRLLYRPLGEPSFTAVGIRRPSGRFQGVLNIGSAILPSRHVSVLAAEAIASSGVEAIGYRVLMMGTDNPRHKSRRQRLAATPASEASTSGKGEDDSVQDPPRVLKERNAEMGIGAEVEKMEENQGFQRKNSLYPSDQNLPPVKNQGFHRKNSLDPSDQNLPPVKATHDGRPHDGV